MFELAFWFFRVKDNPFGWLVCHMSFIQIEMRENERRDRLVVVLFEETEIVEVITQGIIRLTIENLKALLGRREWNGMERNEKNHFRIFFPFHVLEF